MLVCALATRLFLNVVSFCPPRPTPVPPTPAAAACFSAFEQKVTWLESGERAAHAALRRFLLHRLPIFAEQRNDPTNRGATSDLCVVRGVRACVTRCSSVFVSCVVVVVVRCAVYRACVLACVVQMCRVCSMVQLLPVHVYRVSEWLLVAYVLAYVPTRRIDRGSSSLSRLAGLPTCTSVRSRPRGCCSS